MDDLHPLAPFARLVLTLVAVLWGHRLSRQPGVAAGVATTYQLVIAAIVGLAVLNLVVAIAMEGNPGLAILGEIIRAAQLAVPVGMLGANAWLTYRLRAGAGGTERPPAP